MSTAVIDFPQTAEIEEEAAKREAEAKHHFSIICKAGGLISTNSLRIGFHAHALKKGGLFGILGFENEREAQEASGVGDSTWFANIRLAEQFDGVSEDLFCGMKQANCRALADMPTSKRLDEYWLRRAATDSMDTFAALVDDEMEDKARASDGKERTVSYSVKMPKSRRKAVQSGLAEISKEYGCDGDESRTLELLVAEKTGSVSLIGAIKNAVLRCGRIKELLESGLSSDEILGQVVQINEETILECASALDGVQNLESV